jgi:thiosulfate/3-mercaptopyruvate sulfurtransferase
MFWKTSLSIASAFLLLTACSTNPEAAELSSLIEIQTLEQLKEQGENLILVDVRPETEFVKGHIPGAVNIWRTELENSDYPYGGMAPDAANFAVVLGKKGVSDKMKLILYDEKGGVEAARLWWLLKRYGFNNSHILNGGLQVWSGDLERGLTESPEAGFAFGAKENPDVNVSYEQFELMRERPGVKVIDCRSDVEFSGQEMKKGAFMAGHVPGAVHFDYSQNINYDPDAAMRLHNQTTLKDKYSSIAAPEDTVLIYCHSGVRSSHTYFVLTELLGYPHVYNYDGSWIEWSYKNQPSATDSISNEQQLQL